MNLAERLRGVLHTPNTRTANPLSPRPASSSRPIDDVSRVADADAAPRVLGGEWHDTAAGRCLVVERRVDAGHRVGSMRVGDLAARVMQAGADAHLLANAPGASPPFLFFDLETTGLSGGAGTYAFLVGCGGFDEHGGFVSRQYLLVRFEDERPLLGRFDGDLSRAGALVSFNGKSFDAPVLETRFLFHRMAWRGAEVPHLDVLHPARRFWGAHDQSDGCSLGTLERHVLGARRVGDVPGFEIPARYFHFVRSGDARPLAAVLEHNRLDLLSLAGLTARLLTLVNAGADAAMTAAEATALGRLYARAGREEQAHAAYLRASTLSAGGGVRAEALRGLAVLARRARRFDEAARHWRQLLELSGCPAAFRREASEALAVHHEHRVRDLAAARAFALSSLEAGERAHQGRPAWTAAVRHRVARIERKMTGAIGGCARLELGEQG